MGIAGYNGAKLERKMVKWESIADSLENSQERRG
jgi:hypothetical protein